MLKWKRGYPLLQKNKQRCNEEGITLVELVASLSLLSVVVILVGTAHIFGQKQFLNQAEAAGRANDLSYALSVISRELRISSVNSVSGEDDLIQITEGATFNRSGTSLIKKENGIEEILAENIDEFLVLFDPEDRTLKITLSSSSDRNNQSEKYETTIYFRR